MKRKITKLMKNFKQFYSKGILYKLIILGTTLLLISGATTIGMILTKTNHSTTKSNTFIVKFESSGGTKIKSLSVKKNSVINKPSDPTKEGFKFIGWFLNDKEYNFEKNKVNKNITLVARWEIIPGVEIVNIKFNTDGGSNIDDIQIVKGASLILPNNPTKNGYKFKYWSYNDLKFNSNDIINENIILKAVWEKEKKKEVKSETKNEISHNKTKIKDKSETSKASTTSTTNTTSSKNRLTVSTTNLSIELGKTETFTYNADPKDEMGITIWEEGNNLLNVSFNTNKQVVYVIGEKLGKTKILVANDYGGLANRVYKYVNVKVYENSVSSVSINNKEQLRTMNINYGKCISYNIYPSNATNKNVTLTSSNNSVATISNGNCINPISAGTSTITLTSQNNNKKDSFLLTVNKVSVNSVKIDKCAYEMPVRLQEHIQLKANVYPEQATNKSIIWESQYPEKATIDQNGNLKVMKTGLIVIKAKSAENPQITDTCYLKGIQ